EAAVDGARTYLRFAGDLRDCHAMHAVLGKHLEGCTQDRIALGNRGADCRLGLRRTPAHELGMYLARTQSSRGPGAKAAQVVNTWCGWKTQRLVCPIALLSVISTKYT